MIGDAGKCGRILREFLMRVAANPVGGDYEGIGFMRFILHAFLGETDAEIENRVRQMREDFLANPDLPEGMEVR